MEEPDLVDGFREGMNRDGFVQIPAGDHLQWAVDLEAMARATETLLQAGWPAGVGQIGPDISGKISRNFGKF